MNYWNKIWKDLFKREENKLCGLLSHTIAESAIFFLPIIYMGGYLIWHWTRSSVSDDARDPPWGNVWNRENRSCRPANGVINVCLLSLEQYFNNTQNKYSICTIAWIWNTCTKNNTIVSFMFLFFIQQSTWFNKQTTMVSNTWQLKHNYTNIAHICDGQTNRMRKLILTCIRNYWKLWLYTSNIVCVWLTRGIFIKRQ